MAKQTKNIKIFQERVRCLKIIKAQETELSDLQEKFGQIRSHLRAANIKNEDLTNQLDELTYRIKKRVSQSRAKG